MHVRMTDDSANPIVWPEELTTLPSRKHQLVWVAYCVAKGIRYLSPYFRSRAMVDYSFGLLCAHLRGERLREDEIIVIATKLDEIADVAWGMESDPTDPKAWPLHEGYTLEQFQLSYFLLDLVLRSEPTPLACHEVVENASRIYAFYLLYVMGISRVDEHPLLAESLQLPFHAMARDVYQWLKGCDVIPLLADCPEFEIEFLLPTLTSKVLNKARKFHPPPKEEEKWLRETGQYRGPVD